MHQFLSMCYRCAALAAARAFCLKRDTMSRIQKELIEYFYYSATALLCDVN